MYLKNIPNSLCRQVNAGQSKVKRKICVLEKYSYSVGFHSSEKLKHVFYGYISNKI